MYLLNYWSNRLSIKNKMLVSYALLILIPLILIASSLTFTYKKSTYEKLSTQTLLDLDKYRAEFTDNFSSIGSILNQLLADKPLEEIVLTPYENTLQVFKAYYKYNTFKVYTRYFDEISSIKLYCYNDTLLDNGYFIPATEDIQHTNWFKNLQAHNGKILWQYDTINSATPSYHLTYELKGTTTHQPLGVLSIEMNHEELDSYLTNAYFDTFVFDFNGHTLSSNTEDVSAIQSLTLPEDTTFTNNAIIDVTYNQQKAKLLINIHRIDYLNLGLAIASIIPESYIAQDTWQSLVPVLVILGFSSILSILLILFFNQSICRRVHRLCLTMNQVALGNFDVPLDIDGTDEIAQLYLNLKKMIVNINNLVNEVYTTNLQKQQLLIHQKDIQFQMLSNQVNPHFLFNMLESIRMKAHLEGCEELADIIEALAFMIRRHLDKCMDLVPISYEVEILETYLKLIHFRFRDRISYTLHYEDYLDKFSIPYLIIQPLVENAIAHGIEPKGTPGHIDIKIYEENNGLIIEVIDNGIGMDDITLNQLYQSFHDDYAETYKHIGLKNIDSRIKLIYGKSYGITLQSIPNLGTSVKISLPTVHVKGESIC